MERELIASLLTEAEKYSKNKGIAISTIGCLCARDARFFSRLKNGHTLTLRKYDEVMKFLRRGNAAA